MEFPAAVLADTPRRWRMPPLARSVEDARAAATDTALAFAIESARTGAAPGARELFIEALAALITESLDPAAGDPAFKALLARGSEPSVREFVALQSQAAQDARTVRRLVDAVAHPARHAAAPDGERGRVTATYELARKGHWRDLLADAGEGLATHPSLQRLARHEALRDSPAVIAYLELMGAQGPLAGTAAASESGRNSARTGDAAESEVVTAMLEIAQVLAARGGVSLRVAQGLKTPRGFPGDTRKAKDEWDVALLEQRADGAHVVLLGEVKAAPAAAPGDYSRLHRGLVRLAQAEPGTSYEFASNSGNVALSGDSLRTLAPALRELPRNVVYFSTAPAGQVPPPLSAASKAVLMGEEGSVAFAQDGDSRHLAPVWDALTTEPRLVATLHQYDTARRVCDAMLHPQDLLETFRAWWANHA